MSANDRQAPSPEGVLRFSVLLGVFRHHHQPQSVERLKRPLVGQAQHGDGRPVLWAHALRRMAPHANPPASACASIRAAESRLWK